MIPNRAVQAGPDTPTPIITIRTIPIDKSAVESPMALISNAWLGSDGVIASLVNQHTSQAQQMQEALLIIQSYSSCQEEMESFGYSEADRNPSVR
jgi:hypothetical protein